MLLTSMAADIMAALVQFRSNIFFFSIFLISCSGENAEVRFLNYDQVSIKHRGGVVYVNDSIFTGVLYALAPTTGDTLLLSPFQEGREHGTWKQFYEGGAPKEIRHFVNGKKAGEYKGWWQDG